MGIPTQAPRCATLVSTLITRSKCFKAAQVSSKVLISSFKSTILICESDTECWKLVTSVLRISFCMLKYK